VGCGAGTSSRVGTDATEEQPPANTDQPPNNAGDTATNPDKVPSNPDSPPSSSEDPAGSGGGGRLTALCHQICDTLSTLANDCGDAMGDLGMGMENVCAGDVQCQIPADLPCQNEIADAFDCLFDNLALICVDDAGPGKPQGPKEEPCRDVGRALTQCTGANEPVDNENGNGNGNGNQGDCTAEGGCECPTECTSCTCEAGADLTALQACGTGACAP
jgi:hypothetical protein